MIIAVSSAAIALSCQGCAGFNEGYSEAPVAVRVQATAAEFADSTAAIAAPPMTVSLGQSYNAYDVMPNSFNTPLYGAPLNFIGETEVISIGGLYADFSPNHSVLTSVDWSSSEGVTAYKAQRKAARVTQPLEVERDFAGEISFSAPKAQTGLDFDVGIAPRFTVQDEGPFSRRSFGAEVRLGQEFDARGPEPSKGWYVFAGADGEALVWETGRAGFADMDAMKLRDQVTVGDIQAGFAIHRGGGELSLSYIRREVEYSDRNGGFSTNENFAGISYTLKH